MADYHIKHITRYTYPSPVIDSANQVMLFPLDDAQQQVKKHELIITQQPAVEVFTDYFGNKTGLFSVLKPHTELTIESQIDVVVQETVLPQVQKPVAAQWEELGRIRDEFPYMDFMLQEQGDCMEEVQQLAGTFRTENSSPFDTAAGMSAFVYNNFTYRKGVTSVETKVDEIWKIKAGVCQDFAHVLLVMLRFSGIPARYVSGYICPKNHELRGEGATHAWVEAYIPFYGWLGLDPTNNCIVSERHVRLAVGRSFTDCTPVKGTYKGSSDHTLEVSVIIGNGNQSDDTAPATPVFSYQVHNTASAENNSYRRFIEMQQQQ